MFFHCFFVIFFGFFLASCYKPYIVDKRKDASFFLPKGGRSSLQAGPNPLRREGAYPFPSLVSLSGSSMGLLPITFFLLFLFFFGRLLMYLTKAIFLSFEI